MLKHSQARLRQLPDGLWISLDHCQRDRNLLQISLSASTAPKALSPVEIDCGDTVYLGEMEGGENGELLIRVEHVIDERQCAWLRQVWSEPGL